MAESALEGARGGVSPPPLPRRRPASPTPPPASPPPVPPPIAASIGSLSGADAFSARDSAAPGFTSAGTAVAIASVAASFGFLGALVVAIFLSPPAAPEPIAITAERPVVLTESRETSEEVAVLPAATESPLRAPEIDTPAASELQDESPDTSPSPAAIAETRIDKQREQFIVQPVSLNDPVAAAAVSSPWQLPGDSAAVCDDGSCQAQPRTLGTSIEWASSVAEASQRARREEKLVFLIHVSGNFALPEFT
jgi:hypothetical protein